MRHHGIRAIMARPRRVRTTDRRHDLPIAPNLLDRNFIAAAPIAAQNRCRSSRPATAGRPGDDNAARPDRSERRPSRKADCYDNAPMESFFHTLKTKLVHHRLYATRAEAKRDIFAYIEGFYSRTHRHSAIGYISPIEMELKAA